MLFLAFLKDSAVVKHLDDTLEYRTEMIQY